MAFLKLTEPILDAVRGIRRGGRLVVNRGKARHDRLTYIPGAIDGLELVHQRTVDALKRHGLIKVERYRAEQTRYKLTDLGVMLVDDIKSFRRLMREANSVRGTKRPKHDVDCGTRCCRKCGRTLAQLLAELDRDGDVQPCVPAAAAIGPAQQLALPAGDDVIDGEYEVVPDAGP